MSSCPLGWDPQIRKRSYNFARPWQMKHFVVRDLLGHARSLWNASMPHRGSRPHSFRTAVITEKDWTEAGTLCTLHAIRVIACYNSHMSLKCMQIQVQNTMFMSAWTSIHKIHVIYCLHSALMCLFTWPMRGYPFISSAIMFFFVYVYCFELAALYYRTCSALFP